MARLCFGWIIIIGFALAQGLTELISIGTPVFVISAQLNTAITLAVIATLIAITTAIGFEGRVIHECLQLPDHFFDRSLLVSLRPLALCKRKIIAKSLMLLYLFFALLIILGVNYFLCIALKGWVIAMLFGKPITLSALSLNPFLLILLYTAIVDWPYMLSNELVKTCQHIAKQLHVPFDYPFQWLLKAIAPQSERIARLGAFGHVLERLPTLMLLTPALLLHHLLIQSPFIFWLSFIVVIILSFFFASLHFVHSYLFNSEITREVLYNYHTPLKNQPIQFRSYTGKFLIRLYRRLIWIQALYYGLYIAFPSMIAAQVYVGHAIGLSICGFLIFFGTFGTYFSEVAVAKANLQYFYSPNTVANS